MNKKNAIIVEALFAENTELEMANNDINVLLVIILQAVYL